MDRRNFLKQAGGLLAAIPALAWAEGEMPIAETEWPYLYIPPSDEAYGATPDEHWADDLYTDWGNSDNDELYMWNRAGDSWKSSDGGKTWERWGSQAEYEFDDLYLSFEDIHNDFILASNQEYFEGLDEAITTGHR